MTCTYSEGSNGTPPNKPLQLSGRALGGLQSPFLTIGEADP